MFVLHLIVLSIVILGTDGHLKLTDFGLSKIVAGLNKRGTATAIELPERIESDISEPALLKIRKFLPLKAEVVQKREMEAVGAHRTLKVLHITMDDSKDDATLLFINMTVQVSIADYDIDSDTIKLSQFEVIFIDGDYYEEDSVELVSHFCSHLFNGLPVLLCAKDEELRRRGLAAGARACSRLALDALTEDTFDAIMVSDSIGVGGIADPLHEYLVDLIALQEFKAKQLLQQQGKESPRHSIDGEGFKDGSPMRMRGNSKDGHSSIGRDSVTVASKSHSLVGTLHFIAPEVIRLRRYGKAVDWWAVGMTIYECLVGKHLFEGEEKKVVFENIMNAPIVLDELLAQFGEAVTHLVYGLLNRDIKRRFGSHGSEVIKAHRLFERIDWATVSTSNPVHKPAQFVNKKYRPGDKDLFYGPRNGIDASVRLDSFDDRSMQKYLQSKKMSKSSKDRNSSGSAAKNGKSSFVGCFTSKRSRRLAKSKSFSRSQFSGSLEAVAEISEEELV